jgi:CRISPR/Cas system-associated endonuclease Cas1
MENGEFKEEYNKLLEDDKRFHQESINVCNFCSREFDDDNIHIHMKECLYNYLDVHTCTTCKHCEINLVPPYGDTNGYTSQSVQEFIGDKSFISCAKNIYNGKISDEKILRRDKKCYEQIDENDEFIIIKDKEYLEYKEIINEAIIEQDEIDDALNRIREEALGEENEK